MKIWNGFGTEHSWNLVMIGTFKSSDDALSGLSDFFGAWYAVAFARRVGRIARRLTAGK